MIIVSDTSPLSSLIQIGRLNLLQQIFGQVIIPNVVLEELKNSSKRKIAIEEVEFADWINIIEPSDRQLVNKIIEEYELHRGEAEAIALSNELNADKLLIDEMKGRAVAKQLNLKITGTLGVLLKAKEKGYIDKIKPEMDKLIAIEFWIKKPLYHLILKQANEL